ncbi:uncharacterized protein [Mytilus edulis]|uniref:uncharacterized protein n=1 Tax=Mytilus edulis TaxID=6550 RepID=UPI0039EF480D
MKYPRIRQLGLFIDDDGLVRCNGRIHNAPISENTKFPYLIPANYPLTKLIVMDAHERSLHSGLNATLTYVRQSYWVPTLRQFVKKLLNKCVTCRKVMGKSYNKPDPPPLPKIRVQEASPFTVTGVDYTGALYIKNSEGTLRKAYICLFTCASTRAVHLEVVPNLSEHSFIQAFRRFVSRKSLPKILVSDNATTFIAGSAEKKRLCESDIVKDTLSTHGVEWRFIPKRAPWYGGFWERLIALTKTSLKKVLGRSQVNMETLQTVVTEIETILNDRPLTYPSSNIKDCEALTPSHLLYGRRISTLPYPQSKIENILDPTYMGHKDLNKSVYRQTQLIQHFWKRWKSEYHTSLREFHRTIGKNEQLINTGDIVQIHNECPRINWKIGIVIELARGNDGLVRSARIRTSTGETTRPIAKLYPLEVTQTMTNNSNFPIGEQEHMEDRPKRKASLKARETIQKWIHQ